MTYDREYQNVRAALDRFATLPDNWDDYGAPPPSVDALNVVRDAVREIRALSKKYRFGLESVIPEVAPMPNGGVILSYDNDLIDCTFEIYESGQAFYFYMWDRPKDRETEEEGIPISELVPRWEAWAITSIEALQDQYKRDRELARNLAHELRVAAPPPEAVI